MKAFEYVPEDIQRRAVDFLNKELFTTPIWLVNKSLAEKAALDPYNGICNIQASMLNRLLSARTFDKMVANELLNGSKAYTASEMFADLHKSIWADLSGGQRPDFCRRALQKAYVKALAGMIDKPRNDNANPLAALMGGASNDPSDAPAIARGELNDLRQRLVSAAGASSGLAKSHYQNLVALIDMAFEAK